MFNATSAELVLPPSTVTRHAERRMRTRGIPAKAVEVALTYGRVFETRGAYVHVIGRKEIRECGAMGIDVSAFHGVQVICSNDDVVMTTYRNPRFRTLTRQRGWRRNVMDPRRRERAGR
jgi:hypothetical protein